MFPANHLASTDNYSLNQSNQHTSTYSRIQQHTRNPYYATIHNEYAQENPRINRQDRRKVTFPGSAYPNEISQQYTPATHTEAVHRQRVFHHWRLLDPHWGSVAKPLVSPLTPVPRAYTAKSLFGSIGWMFSTVGP